MKLIQNRICDTMFGGGGDREPLEPSEVGLSLSEACSLAK